MPVAVSLRSADDQSGNNVSAILARDGPRDAGALASDRHLPNDHARLDAPTPNAASPTFGVVRDVAAFAALADDWAALYAAAGTGLQMFQRYDWCAVWIRHYLPQVPNARQKLAIGTIHRGGALIGILPFVTERKHGVTRLAFLGDPVGQYGDVLVAHVPDREAVLADAWAHLVSVTGTDVVDLRKVRADAIIAPLIATLSATITGTEEAPYCDLTKVASYAALEERISAKLKKNWRRQQRRLEDRGLLTSDVLSAGDAAAEDARLALIIKRAWLIEKGLLSRAFKDDRFQNFFADAARLGAAKTGVGLDVLRTNGEMAAASLSVSAKDRRALHVVVYGLKFEKAGAGSINLANALRRAFEDGVKTFDFLAPRHDYKMDWADGVVAVNDYALALTARGRLYSRVYLGGIRSVAKATIARLPTRARRLLAWVQKRPALIGFFT